MARHSKMLFQFSLYGFLKNQRYFEPFLILAFLEKGLSFTDIGFLVGFREICVNFMEMPTGAIADVTGRRRSMILSFASYIISFAIFGLTRAYWALFVAMFFFSIGEAFRTGTHKAMIFDWLSSQGRADEKTLVYGFTRSWSKMGSAVSVVIAAVMVFVTKQYSFIFLVSIIPYLGNIVNFLMYPATLDGAREKTRSMAEIWRVLWASLAASIRSKPLRVLMIETMSFDGAYKVCKDYLQPILFAAALSLPFLTDRQKPQRVAVLVGAVYLVVYLLSSYASRHSDTVKRRAGSEVQAARLLWWMFLGIFGVLTAGLSLRVAAVAVAAFVALEIIQNFWRPIMISRFASHADPSQMATVLSIESQARSIFAAVLAPLLGWTVDSMVTLGGAPADGNFRFLPVGIAGLVIGAVILAWRRPGVEETAPADTGEML